MSSVDINRITISGNLTQDPELRSTPNGTPVGTLRVASNTRRKNPSTGEWESKPNYIDVTVWGADAENCARYLAKGSRVFIDGELEYQEWAAQDHSKRHKHQIKAQRISFEGSPNGQDGSPSIAPATAVPADVPVTTASAGVTPAAAAAAGEDDMPF
jgi:single-strand DNA-binding protein